MSYGLLQLLMYILFVFSLACWLFYYAIQQWRKQRKAQIGFYLTLGIGLLVMIILKILEKTTKIYENNIDLVGVIIFGFIFLIFAELAFISATCKPDATNKKILLIAWSLIIIPSVMLPLILYIFR